MKTHSTIGGSILGEHNSSLMKMATKIAVYHHEKWDGSGYPLGLAGDKIPVEARIVSICDVFDALISTRPYKKAWSCYDSIEYVKKQSGVSFDPYLVDKFMEISDEIIHYAEQYKDQAV